MRVRLTLALPIAAALVGVASAQESRTYANRLTPIRDPKPLLADQSDFIAPIKEVTRFEAPLLVDDKDADLHVRAWRFSYNARGIIEMPNRLRAAETAIIMVHPWGIDDENGWKTPEPAGCADFCTPRKNHLAARHTKKVIDPFLQSLRGEVACVMYWPRGNRIRSFGFGQRETGGASRSLVSAPAGISATGRRCISIGRLGRSSSQVRRC